MRFSTGDGLSQIGDKVIVTRAGVLKFQEPNIFWVSHRDHRYTPKQDDNVIGVVMDTFSENYSIDITGTSTAQLSTLAFDGATNRNKPNLSIGALVFARVSRIQRDMHPELSCMVWIIDLFLLCFTNLVTG